VVERLGPGVGEFLTHLALPSLAATSVGWWAYRRHWPTTLPARPAGEPDRRALTVGGIVVAGLLVGFVVGPSVGVQPWMCALAADVVLAVITRIVPWRDVPVGTAALVAAIAAVVAVVVPADALGGPVSRASPGGLVLVALGATGAANVVNNLPALLVVVDGVDRMSWGVWAWLLGVNAGAVLVPIGALANLLWWRIVRDEGIEIDIRRYLRITVPVAAPALAAAVAVLVLERLLLG
jgi:arsenical pump membrane protein